MLKHTQINITKTRIRSLFFVETQLPDYVYLTDTTPDLNNASISVANGLYTLGLIRHIKELNTQFTLLVDFLVSLDEQRFSYDV